MSNYRRLISYIYSYEGGVKGKNIGFAKIESRGAQCRITVNVKKIYVGSNDIGVYLLSGEKEILLGNIFIRGGSGEFRTLVSWSDVEHSGCSIDQCYGLTVHDVDSTWRCYTTIWEDAVAHAAEVELENAVSAGKSDDDISDARIRKAMREIEREFPLDPVMAVEYAAELVPDMELAEEVLAVMGDAESSSLDADIPPLSAVMEQQEIPEPGEAEFSRQEYTEVDDPAESGVDQPEETDLFQSDSFDQAGSSEWRTDSPEEHAMSRNEDDEMHTAAGDQMEQSVEYEMSGSAEYDAVESAEYEVWESPEYGIPQVPDYEMSQQGTNNIIQPHENAAPQTGDRRIFGPNGSAISQPAANMSQPGGNMPGSGANMSQPAANMPQAGNSMSQPGADMSRLGSNMPQPGCPTAQPASDMQPMQPMQPAMPSANSFGNPSMGSSMNPEAGNPTYAAPQQGRSSNLPGSNMPSWSPRSEMPRPSMPVQQPAAPIPQMPVEEPQGSVPIMPVREPGSVNQNWPMRMPEQRMPEQQMPEQRMPGYRMPEQSGGQMPVGEPEEMTHDQVWMKMKQTHTKNEAFDYEHGCEILTIKPQDIGLMAREAWVLGNNSFLLHGYYNHRHLILAKLNNPNGTPYYMLGVPGHYYNNERYMASMFGFPNFVLSKDQPDGDDRFGYWYTYVQLGNSGNS